MIRFAILLFIALQQVGAVRSAAISGMVIDETGAPVGRAWLGLTSGELPGARTAISADDGRFIFADLPAGRFRLTAAKASYLATEFGQRSRDDLATMIRLSDGQRLSNVRLRLPRTASIRGRFVDQAGKMFSLQSWEDLKVSPEVQRRGDDGQANRRLYLSLDQRGGFKIENLPPGTYTLRASPRSPTIDVRLAEGQQAMDVVLPLAQEDTVATLSEIEGDIVGPDGNSRKDVSLQLISLESDPPREYFLRGSPRPDDLGHFALKEIPIGRYLLIARNAIFSQTANDRTFRSFWASSELIVADKIKAYTRLVLQPGVTVQGRIIFDATTLQPPPMPRVSINLVPQDGRASMSASAPGNTASQVFPDGTFTIWSVPPGRYTVNVRASNGMQNLMEGWSLESAAMGNVDVLDRPFTVTDQDVAGIEVRLADQSGSLEGTTRNAAGDAVFDSTVVVFPVDERTWSARARRIRATRPDTSGAFLISDLPAGEYFVAAVPAIEPGAWFDPKTLSVLAPTATRASVIAGKPVRLTLIVR